MVGHPATDREELVMPMTDENRYTPECVRDDAWQRRMRDTILKPYFYDLKAKSYRFLDGNMDAQKRDLDTIANFGQGDRTISEKIVRYPVDDKTGVPWDKPYAKFALETENWGQPSGMSITEAMRLLYCFANLEETMLTCYYMDMQALKAWFKENGHKYKEWIDPKPNHSHCRLVWINDVLRVVTAKVFIIPQA